MSKQVWTVTLKVTQECDEDMSKNEMIQWLDEHFTNSDYGVVECMRVQEVESPDEITFDVTQCPSRYGLRLTLEALLGETDTSGFRWVYEIKKTNYLWETLEKVARSFCCKITRVKR